MARTRAASRNGKRRTRRRRLAFVLVAAVALALLAIVVDGYWQAFGIGRQLEATYPKLQALRQSVAEGKIPDQAAFRDARSAVANLRDRVQGARFTLGFTGALPVVGRPVEAVRLGAAAMDEVGTVTSLAERILHQLFGTPDHPPVFQAGRVDLARLRRAVPLVEAAPEHLRAALADIKAIPHIPLIHRLDSLREEALVQVQSAVKLTSRAAVGFKLLPAFLGGTGPRTYFLAMQNNNDQRGTGGAVLAYGLIRVHDGRIHLLRAGPINDLDDDPKARHLIHAPPSILWYLRAVGRPPRINNGLNYSPNFPEVARMWTRQVQKVTGMRIDGAIALDPFAVSYALRDQGSFRVVDYANPIDSSNLVQLAEHDQYNLPFRAQKFLPSELINGAFQVMTKSPNVLSLSKNMGAALSEKRTQLWFSDRRLERLVGQMGWDGALNPGRGDFVYLAQEKRVINKVDFFTRQDIQHSVRLLPSGDGRVRTRVQLVNKTPPGENKFVVHDWRPYGLNVSMLNLYVPRRSENVVVTPYAPLRFKGVKRLGFMEHREGRTRVYTKHVAAWPGHPGTLTYDYDVPSLAKPKGKGIFEYELTLRHQPLASPAQADTSVRLPAGAQVLHADSAWTVRGETATFRGLLTRDVRASIRYSLPSQGS